MAAEDDAQNIVAAYLQPPPALAQALGALTPVVRPVIKAGAVVVDFLGPPCVSATRTAVRMYSLLPVDLFQALLGFGLSFCGGAYCASIAAVEAFRLSGWEQTRAYLLDVQQDLQAVWAAYKADNAKEDDDELMARGEYAALLQRKLAVAALAIKDPSRLATAIGGLYTAWLAVQGTLRLEFAKTVTLGLSLADLLGPMAERLLLPSLNHIAPAELHHWLPILVRSATRALAVAIAWRLHVIVASVHLALRGGLLFSRSMSRWAMRQGYSVNAFDEPVGYGVAILGFACQWHWSFAMPFPFNLIFSPLSLVEWYIRWSVTTSAPQA